MITNMRYIEIAEKAVEAIAENDQQLLEDLNDDLDFTLEEKEYFGIDDYLREDEEGEEDEDDEAY